MNKSFFSELKYDLPAGLVVFLVALPLCLGIALASGAPLFAGIIAGMVGGIVITLFSGSQLGVSGPAAGLVVIVLAAIQSIGYEAFLLAAVIAGVFQLGLGLARAGFVAYYFPTSVIKGMLAAIGITIFFKQIPHAVGYDADYEGDLTFFQQDGQNTFSELFNMFDYLSEGAMIISGLSLVILILWERPFMKKLTFTQFLPGALAVVLLGIGLNVLFQAFFPALAIQPNHLVSLPVAGSFEAFFNQFTFPDFSQWNNPEVWWTAFILCAVASLETLLTSEATDKLDPFKRITPANQELRAQGIGNIISGLIGGLPITQVIVRSSANIQAGGRTKASAFIHGILLLAAVGLIPRFLNLIPYASLAAVLLMVGYKLAKPTLFKHMASQGIMQFVPFLITILAIIFTDLLVGILIGMGASIFFILLHNFRTPYFFEESDENGVHIIRLAEEVSFLNKAMIRELFSKISDDTRVQIDGSRSVYIDQDVLNEIRDFVLQAQHRNIELELVGFGKGKDSIEHQPPLKRVQIAADKKHPPRSVPMK